MQKSTESFFLTIGLSLIAGTASATAITSDDIEISHTVENECIIDVASLGGATSGALDGNATGNSSTSLTVTCNAGTTYSIVPSTGDNYGEDTNYTSNAAMTDGDSHYVAYSLYQGSGTTSAWDSSNPIEGTGTGSAVAITVGYQVYDLNLAPAGEYSDTFTATLTY